MFWKHFAPPISETDSLLEKEDCTLSEVLDSEDVLQECKGLNEKLLDFLSREDILRSIVSLVTSEPDESIEETERYRHSNVACSLLTCGSDLLVDCVVRNDALLDKLFAFLDSESPQNCLVASFFSRVAADLFAKRPLELFKYAASRENFLERILAHIGTSAVMDLLLGIIGTFQRLHEREKLCEWVRSQGLIPKLADCICAEQDEAKQHSASRVLIEMHRGCYEFLAGEFEREITEVNDELLSMLEGPETIERLLTNALARCDASASPVEDLSAAWPLRRSLELLCSMLSLQQTGVPNGSYEIEPSQYLNVRNEEAARCMAQCVAPHLSTLVSVLKSPTACNFHQYSVEEHGVPLGVIRLDIIRLINLLAQTNCTAFDKELLEHNFIGTLLDLFQDYAGNNFLHNYVEQFISTVLSQDSEMETEMLRSLFIDNRILQRLAASALKNESQQTFQHKPRLGFMGYLVCISNNVLHSIENTEELRPIVGEISSDDLDEWRAWVDGPLETVNSLNEIVLGGSMPAVMVSMSESEDEFTIDMARQSNDTSDAFSFYNNQLMASDFDDDFGFDDKDFTEQEMSENALFDQSKEVEWKNPANVSSQSMNSLFEEAMNQKIERYSDDDEEDEAVKEASVSGESSNDCGETHGTTASTTAGDTAASL